MIKIHTDKNVADLLIKAFDFWSTVMAKTINGEKQLHALVDGKMIIINESSVRRDLQLADEEGVDCLPNSTIFEQLTLMGKPKRKDTQVPQPSDHIENVADEAVHKELGDSLVRAATTASSLEAEQDSGNINKTQSKATPNESSFQETNSCGGPRCQETIGDTIAQTSLKKKVKKLEKKNRSRTHRLKRLYKVGLTARVESSDNEESLGEDAKQGRIDAIDANEEITLVSVHDVNVSAGDEIVLQQQLLLELIRGCYTRAGESTTNTNNTTYLHNNHRTKLNLMKKKDLQERKLKKMQAQKQEELSIEEKAILFQQLLEKRRKHFAAKRAEEKRNKPPTKAQQRKIMCTYLKNMEGYKLKDLKLKELDSIQEMFDRAFKRQKVEDDKETTELKQLMKIIPDEEEVAIDAIPLAVKSPSIVGWKIHKEGRKSYYQIMRADRKSQMYMIFSQMLKSFNREDLKDLYKLVKAKYESTRPVEDLDLIL
ncbi:hypothetical protein Tco_0658802 [Tanacetum coccineum]